MTIQDVRDYEARMQAETNEKVRLSGSESGTPVSEPGESEAGGSVFGTPASSPAQTPTTPSGGKKGWFW